MVLINEIRRQHGLRRAQRVGRGGKRGTYSGRGQKGQRARAGRNIKSQARESLLKIPQRRGTGSKTRALSLKRKPLALNVNDFVAVYKEGETVSPKTLVQRGIISKVSGRIPAVKILGRGKVDKKLVFSGVFVSRIVRTQVEKLGGTIK